MLEPLSLDQVMVLDIETVPEVEHYDALSSEIQKLWEQKTAYQRKDTQTPEEFYHRAGIWAEFGKIICISVGIFSGNKLRIKSFFGDDEEVFLQDFIQLLQKQPSSLVLCAHNGKEFDFPYLCRRILINGLKLPPQLQIAGKKPWEINHIDTMDLWRFGDHKHYTSLNLLCQVFKIPTSKEDISGEDVSKVYWDEKNLPRIVNYCQKDVIATCQILLRYKGLPLIENDNITIV